MFCNFHVFFIFFSKHVVVFISHKPSWFLLACKLVVFKKKTGNLKATTKGFSYSHTKFIAIILVLWSFMRFAKIFRPILLTFRPRKWEKQVKPGKLLVAVHRFYCPAPH